MSSTQQENTVGEFAAPERSQWAKPEFERLKIEEAEARDGTGPDNSGLIS